LTHNKQIYHVDKISTQHIFLKYVLQVNLKLLFGVMLIKNI